MPLLQQRLLLGLLDRATPIILKRRFAIVADIRKSRGDALHGSAAARDLNHDFRCAPYSAPDVLQLYGCESIPSPETRTTGTV